MGKSTEDIKTKTGNQSHTRMAAADAMKRIKQQLNEMDEDVTDIMIREVHSYSLMYHVA